MPANNHEILRVSIKPKGIWSDNVYYERLDLVHCNGATYLAISPSQAIEPSVAQGWQMYWMLVVKDANVEGAEQLYRQAVKLVDAVKNMTVSVEEIEPFGTASVEKTYDSQTGVIHLAFKIPIATGVCIEQDGNKLLIT